MPRPSVRKIDIPAAQAMRDAGQSYRAIGRAFGVSGVAVYFALNPDKRYFPSPRRGKSDALGSKRD